MPTQVKFVLFDLDGLLIDTESIYTIVTNEILAPYGCEMTMAIKAGLMGKNEAQATAHLFNSLPPIALTPDEYVKQRRLGQAQRWPSVKFMPGAERLVAHLAANKIPMAIATGSGRAEFELKTNHLQDTFKLFEGRSICASDPQMAGRNSKPAPDVFIEAGKLLGVDLPKEGASGLVFEDAVPGMQAGVAAGAHVVWVPDEKLEKLVAESTGDVLSVPEGVLKLASLEDFVPEAFGLPPYAA